MGASVTPSIGAKINAGLPLSIHVIVVIGIKKALKGIKIIDDQGHFVRILCMNRWIIFGLLLFTTPAYSFRPFILHSGKNKISVLEFYTSETCEECLDGEKWFSTLRGTKGLFKKFIALSFLMPEFKSRITEDSELPVIKLNGDVSPWNDDSKSGPDPLSLSAAEVGDLSVARNRLKEFEITFLPKEKLENIDINVALLGTGKLRTLTVLEYLKKQLNKTGKSYSGHVKLKMEKNEDTQTYSAVFWVTRSSDGTHPIQATGGDFKLE